MPIWFSIKLDNDHDDEQSSHYFKALSTLENEVTNGLDFLVLSITLEDELGFSVTSLRIYIIKLNSELFNN